MPHFKRLPDGSILVILDPSMRMYLIPATVPPPDGSMLAILDPSVENLSVRVYRIPPTTPRGPSFTVRNASHAARVPTICPRTDVDMEKQRARVKQYHKQCSESEAETDEINNTNSEYIRVSRQMLLGEAVRFCAANGDGQVPRHVMESALQQIETHVPERNGDATGALKKLRRSLQHLPLFS